MRAWSAALLLLASGCGDEGGALPPDAAPEVEPRLDLLSPDVGPAATRVELHGVRFCGPGPDDATADGTCTRPLSGYVGFGAARATIEEWRDGLIVARVPGEVAPGVVDVAVTTVGRRSNALPFTVVAP